MRLLQATRSKRIQSGPSSFNGGIVRRATLAYCSALIHICALFTLCLPSPASAEDIVDLIQKRNIEVEINGAGISNVIVKLRRAPNQTQPIDVSIPIGTYFVAGKRSTQNMVG